MSLGGGSTTGAPQTSSTNQSQNTSQNGTNTTAMGPWDPQQSFLLNSFNNATNLNNTNNQLPVSSLLQSSIGDMTAAAQNTPSFVGQGNNYLNNVLSGANLSPNSNPYLAQSVQAAEQPIMNNFQTAIAPQVASNSEMANRYGSGEANQQMNQANTALLNNLSNTSANMYTSAYNQGIQQQESAAGQIPGQLAANYAPSLLENQAGQQQQALMQAQAQYPWMTAQQLQQIVGGNYGQSGTTTSNQTGTMQGTSAGQGQQAYFTNPFGQAAGAGLAGLGTAGQLGLFGQSGLGGLFGAGAVGADGLPLSGLGALTGTAASGAAAAGGTAAAAGGAASLAELAPLLAFAA